MKLIIETAQNGARLTVCKEPEDTEGVDVHTVYEFGDGSRDDDKSLKGLVSLLYDLAEAAGWTCGGKYNKERLTIHTVHGSEYQCDEKQCHICNKPL